MRVESANSSLATRIINRVTPALNNLSEDNLQAISIQMSATGDVIIQGLTPPQRAVFNAALSDQLRLQNPLRLSPNDKNMTVTVTNSEGSTLDLAEFKKLLERAVFDSRFAKAFESSSSLAHPVVVSMGTLGDTTYNSEESLHTPINNFPLFNNAQRKACASTVVISSKRDAQDNLRVHLFQPARFFLGIVMNPEKIEVPYADFEAVNSMSRIPKEPVSKNGKYSGSKYPTKMGSLTNGITVNGKGIVHHVDRATWDSVSKSCEPKGSLSLFVKNLCWRAYGYPKKPPYSRIDEHLILPLNEALVQARYEGDNPIMGLLINVDSLNDFITNKRAERIRNELDELLQVIEKNPDFNLYLYDKRLSVGIVRQIEGKEAIETFINTIKSSTDAPLTTDQIGFYPCYKPPTTTEVISTPMPSSPCDSQLTGIINNSTLPKVYADTLSQLMLADPNPSKWEVFTKILDTLISEKQKDMNLKKLRALKNACYLHDKLSSDDKFKDTVNGLIGEIINKIPAERALLSFFPSAHYTTIKKMVENIRSIVNAKDSLDVQSKTNVFTHFLTVFEYLEDYNSKRSKKAIEDLLQAAEPDNALSALIVAPNI